MLRRLKRWSETVKIKLFWTCGHPWSLLKDTSQLAVLIDVNNADFKQKVNTLDKSKTTFVYCAAGVRSEKAVSILKDSGLEKLYHLEDGLNSWTNKC